MLVQFGSVWFGLVQFGLGLLSFCLGCLFVLTNPVSLGYFQALKCPIHLLRHILVTVFGTVGSWLSLAEMAEVEQRHVGHFEAVAQWFSQCRLWNSTDHLRPWDHAGNVRARPHPRLLNQTRGAGPNGLSLVRLAGDSNAVHCVTGNSLL